MARGALLDEGSVVGSDVSVVGVLLQHVDLQLDFLLFVLNTSEEEETSVIFKFPNSQTHQVLQITCGGFSSFLSLLV